MPLSRIALALSVGLIVAVPARAVDPYLPADTQAYVSVNLRKALDSKLFKENALAPAREAIKSVPPVADLLAELGLDPFKDIDSVILSSPLAKEHDRGLVIVHGSFSEVKLKAKAAKLKKAKDESVKVHEVSLGSGVKHDVYELAVNGEMSVFVALASPKVVLLSPGKDYIIDALKQGRAGKKVALKNKELQELIEGLDAKQALTVAVPGKLLHGVGKELDFLPEKLRDALKHVEAVGGGVSVGDSFKLELAITTRNAENARAIREAMNFASKLALAGLGVLGTESPEINLAFEVVKSIKVTGRGKVVGLNATLTADTLKDLFGGD
jgi:hypothetical protein